MLQARGCVRKGKRVIQRQLLQLTVDDAGCKRVAGSDAVDDADEINGRYLQMDLTRKQFRGIGLLIGSDRGAGCARNGLKFRELPEGFRRGLLASFCSRGRIKWLSKDQGEIPFIAEKRVCLFQNGVQDGWCFVGPAFP